jgi:transposase
VDGVRPAQAPWTAPNSRFTLLFEQLAITVLEATKVQRRAAGILRLSPNEMHRIMERAVARGLARRAEDLPIARISLDEKSIAAGHEYMTVLADSVRGIVIDVADGRTTQGTRSLLRSALSVSQRETIECVTMDMWRPFADAVRFELPDADVAHDRFHIAKYLGKAVDDTRKAENARLSKEGVSPLVKSKYIWLKNPENLTEDQNALLLALQNSQLDTPKVWAFKEAFKEFFGCKKRKAAKTYFENWHEQALALKNPHLTKVADMLKRHLEGLLAVIKHKASNAIAEAINSKIQALKTAARGFRSFANYRIAILFFYGGLSLNPQIP